MSRTYRKSSITEEKSIQEYVNEHLNYVRGRRKWNYYMTPEGELAYKRAMEQYERDYYIYSRGFQPIWKRPTEPYRSEFMKVKITYHEFDYDKEVEYAEKEYKKFNRDGHFYEGNLNRSYKKYCAKDLRRLNHELARKIIKDDESWEHKPYPDTYLGKQYVWDYW